MITCPIQIGGNTICDMHILFDMLCSLNCCVKGVVCFVVIFEKRKKVFHCSSRTLSLTQRENVQPCAADQMCLLT